MDLPAGKKIQHFSEGDTLSPMLFILAIDILDRVIRKAAVGFLQPNFYAICFRVKAVKFHCSFYADHAIMFASGQDD